MRFTAGARKRGYTEAEVLHALRNYTDVYQDQGDLGLAMFIGPTPKGELIEVGVEMDDDGDIERVAHVMPVRTKYLRHKRR